MVLEWLTRGGCKWRFDCIFSSVRRKRFRLVLEKRKTKEWDFRFGQREKWNENPKKKKKKMGGRGRGRNLSSPPPPRSFPTAIFRAVFDSRSSFFGPKPYGKACYAGYMSLVSLLLPYLSLFTATVHISFQVPGWIGDARFGFKKERWTDFTIIKMCCRTKICKISHGSHAFCPIVGIPSKITHLFHVSSMYS